MTKDERIKDFLEHHCNTRVLAPVRDKIESKSELYDWFDQEFNDEDEFWELMNKLSFDVTSEYE